MTPIVTSTAELMCPFSDTPAFLIVTSNETVIAEDKLVATIMDHMPLVNIPTFGMCISPGNPEAVAAIAAGDPLGAPCIPMTEASPWIPGVPTVLVSKFPAVDQNCKCICLWGGVIEIVNPGTTHTMVP